MPKCFYTALLLLAVALSVWGQAGANKGQISGTVFDKNQAVVPNARITLKSGDTGVVRDAQTGDQGQYQFLLLDPGRYEITVTASGLATKVLTDVIVTVGSAINLPVKRAPARGILGGDVQPVQLQ